MKNTQLTENEIKATHTHTSKGTASRNSSGELTQKVIAREERIQSVVQTATDAIILWDEQGTILFWNRVAVSLPTQGLDVIPPMQADGNRLFIALYNLVNNAIPETPVGGSVTIGGAVGLDGKTVVLTVADTGGGMPPEIRDRLFTKDAISGKAGGTGLGTKIVKDVVDAHSGTVSVHSEPRKGTIFTIQLPITPQILGQ